MRLMREKEKKGMREGESACMCVRKREREREKCEIFRGWNETMVRDVFCERDIIEHLEL